MSNLNVREQNLNIRELDPPTHLHQFDANCRKIHYMSDPLQTFKTKL